MKCCERLVPTYNWGSRNFSPISFKEYYSMKLLELEKSNYVMHLKNWLRVLQRSQIFILKMDFLVTNTRIAMTQLARFLGLQTDWGNNVTLPHDNAAHFMDSLIDCQTRDALRVYYDRENADLLDLANHPQKPPMQPYFEEFDTDTTACSP